MKRFYVLALGLLATSALSAPKEPTRREWGQLVMENIPEIPATLKDRLNQYENVRSASFQGWLPADKGLLISTRFGEASQLHTVAAPQHDRRQITFYDEPVAGALINPRKAELVFTKDIGGNENSQIYLMDLASGSTRLLTDGQSRNESPVWSENGAILAFSSSMRNGRDTDVYLIRPGETTAKPELLVQDGGSWSPVAFSHDQSRLLVRKNVSANESYMHILDLKTKTMERLFPQQSFAYAGAAWSKDDSSLYLVMDIDGEFQTLFQYDLKSKQRKPLTDKIAWNVEGLELSRDGKTLAYVINEGGLSRLYFMDTKTQKVQAIKAIPETALIGRMEFHPQNAKRLAISLSSGTNPGDVYVYDATKNQLQAWTESEMGGLNQASFVEPRLIQFPSFDQVKGEARQIPAFIYKPRNLSGKAPVVINIHGGPEAQYRPSFAANIQYLAAEMGIAVIAPNVRGSSGYGKTFLQLDNGFRREDAVKDIGALLDWIAKQPDLDPTRVLVMGGSYGGYMTLASLVHFSDRLAGGIDIVGISHFISFLNNTKSYRQDLRRVEYGDERDPEMRAFLDRISPLTNVQKIKKPLFVVQGLNDPRVPASEAEQIVKAVRNQGQDAWYLLAKDEGHGFRKKQNQEVYMQTVMMFIEKVLLDETKSASH
jgi:dipeptidyl aminopeptidase/acylaminoacyl peptidase